MDGYEYSSGAILATISSNRAAKDHANAASHAMWREPSADASLLLREAGGVWGPTTGRASTSGAKLCSRITSSRSDKCQFWLAWAL